MEAVLKAIERELELGGYSFAAQLHEGGADLHHTEEHLGIKALKLLRSTPM